jgi:molybdopterin converting factor small subunit
MIKLHLQVLGSLKADFEGKDLEIVLTDHARVKDLIDSLTAKGVEIGTPKYVVALNGMGLHQVALDLEVSPSDSLMLIPPLMGG